MRGLKALTSLLLIAAAGGAVAAARPDPALEGAAVPGRLVPVAPGRRIHLRCLGHGSPTVVLTAGLDGWSVTWRRLQPLLARKTLTCAWDRAGFGHSDPSPDPQDVRHTTADLQAALAAARVPGPYVLVGYSAGSYESLLFADWARRSVAGMVLLDPSVPDQLDRLAAASPTAMARERDRLARQAAALRLCADEQEQGRLDRDAAAAARCFRFPAAWPPALQAALRARDAAQPGRFRTRAAQDEGFEASARELVDPRRDYGRLPLTVFTAETEDLPPGSPPEVAAAWPGVYRVWRQAHRDLAALSRRGDSRVAEGAGHAVQDDRPDLVVAAVEAMVDEARARAGRR